MKLSEWMSGAWEGELPFDAAWQPFSFGLLEGEPAPRPATRLRVFAALSLMAQKGDIGVYATAAPYGRSGVSMNEFVLVAEIRGTCGGFVLANGDEDKAWIEQALRDEINEVTKEINALAEKSL